jgi:hypothetical protein
MENNWPVLKFEVLNETIVTVQRWAQIVGKIRLVKTPWLNHSWHVTFYVSPTGITTGNIPFENGAFKIDFDFIKHELNIISSSGDTESIALYPRTVADFYTTLFEKLQLMGVDVMIYAKPNELADAIPFAEDKIHSAYDQEQMNLFWQALVKIDCVFSEFRAKFIGKCSPVHFFWGSFDLAVSRFSGRTAPKYPGGAPNIPDAVMQEAYSHELSSCGFWGGSVDFPFPCFYAYCYPTPERFGAQPVKPEKAFFSKEMGEFILKYQAVAESAKPDQMLLNFMQSTYEAAANTGAWDREALECDFSMFGRSRATGLLRRGNSRANFI